MTAGPGIEPGTHWWKTSALTTTSTLLPASLDGGKEDTLQLDLNSLWSFLFLQPISKVPLKDYSLGYLL